MPVKLTNISGNGSIKDNSIFSYSYSEEVTSLEPSGIPGATSQVNVSAIAVDSEITDSHADSKLLINNEMSLTTDAYGAISFRVKNVSKNLSAVSIIGDTIQARLNVERSAAPHGGISANLYSAIVYYCGLVNITPVIAAGFVTELTAIPVNFIGWKDIVWNKLKELCAAFSASTSNNVGIEMLIINNGLVFRKARQSVLITEKNISNESISIESFETARSVKVFNYNTSYGTNQVFYDVANFDNSKEEKDKFQSSINDSMQVEAGETLRKRFTVNASFVSVNQPVCVEQITRTFPGPYQNTVLGTVTISVGTPAVVTYAGHGLANGDKIYFTTTGALPTGILAGTPATNNYFVRESDVNTFKLSSTADGSLINTSGTQSGTHTLRRSVGEYVIVGTDDLPIKPDQWNSNGGSVTIELVDENGEELPAGEIELVIKAPESTGLPKAADENEIAFAPYKIGVESSGEADYPALWLTGTGVFYEKKESVFLTGSSNEYTSKTEGPTVDNIFITNSFNLSSRGVAAAQANCGPKIKLTQELAKGFEFGQIGSVIKYNLNDYRVETASFSPSSVSITGSACVSISDWNLIWTGKTFTNFSSKVLDPALFPDEALKFNEFTIIPKIGM